MGKRIEFAPKCELAGREPSVVRLVSIIVAESIGDDEFYDSFCLSDESQLFDFIPLCFSRDHVLDQLSTYFGELFPDSLLDAHLPALLGHLDLRFPGWDNDSGGLLN